MGKYVPVMIVPAGGRAYYPQGMARDERDMTAFLTMEELDGIILVEPKWKTEDPICRD